jgi:adenosylhomocysteine nucleosidase
MRVGLIAAMAQEFAPLEELFPSLRWERLTASPRRLDVLHLTLDGVDFYASACGVGKVNAASVATQLILTYDLNFVLNFGVAGGFQPGQQVLDFVVANSFVYVDVDVCNLGCLPGQLLGEPRHFGASRDSVRIAESLEGGLEHKMHYGRFGSIDQFVRRGKPQVIADIQRAAQEIICVDMESTAIAHVCEKFRVAMGAVRVLSDVAVSQEDGTESFVNTVEEGGRLVVKFVALFMEKLAHKQTD